MTKGRFDIVRLGGLTIGRATFEPVVTSRRPGRRRDMCLSTSSAQTSTPQQKVGETHDLSRNHINVLSSAAVIALPGGYGTAAEVDLAVRYGKPIVAYSPDPNLVVDFHQSVPRADTLETVKRFLQHELGKAGASP
jgi:predicted Rossmann-fold nucleotide-binding protein